ncbi:unnamed protein product [Camellia sinensis]
MVIESGSPLQHIRLIQLIPDRDRTTSLSNSIRPISKVILGVFFFFFGFDLSKAGPLSKEYRSSSVYLWVFNYLVENNLFPYHFVYRVCDCFLICMLTLILFENGNNFQFFSTY